MNLLKRESVQQDMLLIKGNLSSKRGMRNVIICKKKTRIIEDFDFTGQKASHMSNMKL